MAKMFWQQELSVAMLHKGSCGVSSKIHAVNIAYSVPKPIVCDSVRWLFTSALSSLG